MSLCFREQVGKKPELNSHLSSSLEDMMPRSSPAPHRAKVCTRPAQRNYEGFLFFVSAVSCSSVTDVGDVSYQKSGMKLKSRMSPFQILSIGVCRCLQTAVVKPAVPEVSLLWDENSVCEPTTPAKPSQKARPPLKPVNRASPSSSSVPASPTVNTQAAVAKRSVHSSPNSPVVHQGHWTHHHTETVPVRGMPPSQPTPLPMMGAAHPMAQGQMYPVGPVPHPPFRQQWPYHTYPYVPQYPPHHQGYAQPSGIPGTYGYPHPATRAYPGYNPQTGSVGPVPRPGPRQGSIGAKRRQGSHLPMQDTVRPPVSGPPPPTQKSSAESMVSGLCECCPNGVHVKHNETVKPEVRHTGNSRDTAQAADGTVPAAHWPSTVLAAKPAVPQSVSTSAEDVQIQTHSSTVDSLQITQSTESHTLDSSQGSPDVYALLRMQEKQLTQLREQLCQLLAKQSMEEAQVLQSAAPKTRESATQSSGTMTPSSASLAPPKETCSIAINTSLWWPNAVDPQQQQQLAEGSTHSSSLSHSQKHSKGEVLAKPGPPPQHMCSEEEGITHSHETLSLGEFQLTHQLDRTEESMMSEMVVDMPAYTSLSPDK